MRSATANCAALRPEAENDPLSEVVRCPTMRVVSKMECLSDVTLARAARPVGPRGFRFDRKVGANRRYPASPPRRSSRSDHDPREGTLH